jgi:hypothetical protein
MTEEACTRSYFKKLPTAKAPQSLWGILNKHGDFWTTDVFGKPEEALKHLADYWKNYPYPTDDRVNITDYRIVPVTVTLSLKVDETQHLVRTYPIPRETEKAA